MYNKDNWWKPIELAVLKELDKPSNSHKKTIWKNDHTDLWGGVIFIIGLLVVFILGTILL